MNRPDPNAPQPRHGAGSTGQTGDKVGGRYGHKPMAATAELRGVGTAVRETAPGMMHAMSVDDMAPRGAPAARQDAMGDADKMTHRQKLLVHLHQTVSAGGVPMFYSEPGIGKTTMVRDWAHRQSYIFEDFALSEISDEALISGYPVPTVPTDGGSPTVEKALVGCWQRLNAERAAYDAAVAAGEPPPEFPPTVVVIDEITSGRPNIQNAFFNLMANRKSSFVNLPPNTMIVAMGNLQSQSGQARTLAAAMRNRLSWYPVLDPSVEEQTDFLYDLADRELAEALGEPEAHDAEPLYWASPTANLQDPNRAAHRAERMKYWSDVLASFRAGQPEAFSAGSPKVRQEREQGETAYASTRSWTRVAKRLAQDDVAEKFDGLQNASALRLDAVTAEVGDDIAGAFNIFVKQIKTVPDIETYIKDPASAKAFRGQPDRTAYLCRMLAHAAVKEPPAGADTDVWRTDRALSALTALCHVAASDENSETLASGVATRVLLKVDIVRTKDNNANVNKVQAMLKKQLGLKVKEFGETASEYEAAMKRLGGDA